MDYTREQWIIAQQWAKNVSPSNSMTTTAAIAQVVLSSPEPTLVLADVPEDKRNQHVGCAVTVNGKRGWLSWLGAVTSSVLFPCSTGVNRSDGVDQQQQLNTDIILLLDEPRMVIPGVTPEVGQRVLSTLEDFKSAPEGAVVLTATGTLKSRT